MSIDTMQALLLEDYGADYQLREIAIPEPRKGEVLVRIKASGVNPLDLKIKSGNKAGGGSMGPRELPAILGIDMAGIVEAVGEGVTNFAPGDEVYGMTGGIVGIPGSLAQYAAVDARLLAPKPSTLSMKEAAALPLAFITAWEGLVDRANVGAGHNVLIHGGSGGVGNIAVQLSLARGAKVFATDSPARAEALKALGAHPIDYTTTSVEAYVQACTGGEGFDIVFDTLGGANIEASFEAVKQYGHVVSILGWGTHNLSPLSFKGASYSGVFTLLPLSSGKGRERHGEILREATRLAEKGQLKPLVDPTFYDMHTVANAYQSIEQKQAKGKVVIEI